MTVAVDGKEVVGAGEAMKTQAEVQALVDMHDVAKPDAAESASTPVVCVCVCGCALLIARRRPMLRRPTCAGGSCV